MPRHVEISTGSLEPHEIARTFETDAAGFGERMSEAAVEALVKTSDATRTTVSRDHTGDIVGVAVSIPTRTTLPGGRREPTAAVVGVSVAPTHRRQGRLTAMMRHQLDDIRARDEPFATLYASEGTIYGRYGYGPATFGARYVLSKRARLAEPTPVVPEGDLRMASAPEAREVFPALLADHAPTRAGEIDPLPGEFLDVEGAHSQEEARQRFFAFYSEGDRVDGAVSYRVAPIDQAMPWPNRAVFLERFVTVTKAAYVALWNFVLGIDLVEEVRTRGRPLDEPLRWMLEDHRELRVCQYGERTWLRLVDVERALGARGYSAEGSLVIDVHDGFCPWNSGRYRLVAGGSSAPSGASGFVAPDTVQATVERVGEPGGPGGSGGAAPDLTLDARVLASAYLGGVRLADLAESGLVTPSSEERLAFADRLFSTARPPFCSLQI